MGVRGRGCRVTILTSLALIVLPVSSHPQDLGPLISQCASGGAQTLLNACRGAVLAGQAMRGGIAIADAGGAELPGSSSTIGRRLGRSPRVSLAASIRAALFEMPDIPGSGTVAQGTNTVLAYGIKGTMAIGVLDGFSAVPTVGGILSLDLLGSLSLLILSEGDGFSGNQALISGGARLGLFRESFTMPGVTVSAVRRYGGDGGWGNGATPRTEVDTDISATSVRATVGKDLSALAVLVGIGWEWNKGTLGVRVPDPGDPSVSGVASTDALTSRRDVYFIGVSITRLVLQLSLEVGWAGGYDDLPGYQGAYDPGSRVPFTRIAGRLTL